MNMRQRSSSTINFPFINMNSNDQNNGFSRDNSSSFIRFTSSEFKTQYNKYFNPHRDTKMFSMINKTNNSDTLHNIESYATSLEISIYSIENYKKMYEYLSDLMTIANNSENDKEDILKALKLQKLILEKMMELLQHFHKDKDLNTK